MNLVRPVGTPASGGPSQPSPWDSIVFYRNEACASAIKWPSQNSLRPRNRATMPIQIRAAAEPGRPPRFHRLRKVAVGAGLRPARYRVHRTRAGLRPAPTDHRATILAFPEILRQSLNRRATCASSYGTIDQRYFDAFGVEGAVSKVPHEKNS